MVIVTQKDNEGNEWPISFMSIRLQGSYLNYLTIDKQACVVYKVVNQFRPYLLKSHMIIYVPHLAIKTHFLQQELGEKRVNWMTYLHEYDLEFKPAHTIKGNDLCQLTT